MTCKFMSSLAMASALLFSAQSANASLVTYLDDTAAASSFAPDTVAAGVTATTIDNTNTDITAPFRSDFGAPSDGFSYTANATHALSVADSQNIGANNHRYLEFSVTAANAGDSLNLTSIDFDLGVGLNIGPGGTANDGVPQLAVGTDYGFNLFASIDGGTTFTNIDEQVFSTQSQLEELTSEIQNNITVDLTSLGLVANGTDVLFRLSNFVTEGGGNLLNGSSGGQVALNLSNLEINGTVVSAVPEPGSIALLAFSAVVGCVRRRRA